MRRYATSTTKRIAASFASKIMHIFEWVTELCSNVIVIIIFRFWFYLNFSFSFCGGGNRFLLKAKSIPAQKEKKHNVDKNGFVKYIV